MIIANSYPTRIRGISVGSEWLDISQILFFAFLLIKKDAKKERGLYPVILTKQDLSIYKGLIIWPKREPFLAGPALEIPRGQDGPILPAQVANQNTGLLYLARSRFHQYHYTFT